jgi:hypothetical protein
VGGPKLLCCMMLVTHQYASVCNRLSMSAAPELARTKGDATRLAMWNNLRQKPKPWYFGVDGLIRLVE